MSKEELLKPRVKKIAPYPNNDIPVGTIFTKNGTEWCSLDERGNRLKVDERLSINFLAYPHLFKPLEWWEQRKPEDMPEYVKEVAIPKNVFKVVEWRQSVEIECRIVGEVGAWAALYFLPSDQTEYDLYLNSKHQ